MLKFSACSEKCKKACWKFQHFLKTVKNMLKISACSENCNTHWKSVFKISVHVENCNACSKLYWIFQGVLKTSWKFQGMLKTLICVENFVETSCWKFQHVLKTVTHVESYVEVSRCVGNVYVRHVKNHIENHVEVQKKYHHTLWHMLKLCGRFHFSSLILHTLAMWDISITHVWNQVLKVWAYKCPIEWLNVYISYSCLQIKSEKSGFINVQIND